MIKKCIICEQNFESLRADRTICYSKTCENKRDKIARDKRNLLKQPKAKKICSICNTLYTPVHTLQKTCGSPDCIKANKNLSRRKEEFEFDCQVCGAHTWSSMPNSKLCGKKSCRQEYVNAFNRLGAYKNKLRDKIKSKANVSGFYSTEEVDFMIRARLNNKTNPYIALKLKRKLPSIEKKIIDIFNSYKYVFQIEQIKMELEMIKPSKKTRNLQKWNEEIKNYFSKN